MKIAHIADVHIRGLTRHEEYKTVFESFTQDVERNGIEHIFVGGDLFHTKTSGISPEYIDFMSWWLRLLSDHAYLHITLGNHDGNLVNATRQDAVTPIVNALNSNRIKLYKNSGVYQFAPGYNWCVFSLFDEKNWSSVVPVPGDINIACYHGPVLGAKTETDWDIEDGLTVDFFQDFDFCFLGDIHKLQFLDHRDVEMEIDECDLHLYPDASVIEVIE